MSLILRHFFCKSPPKTPAKPGRGLLSYPILLILICLCPLSLFSTEPAELFPATNTTTTVESYRWARRPLLIFAERTEQSQIQRALLKKHTAALAERDVVVLIDADPANQTALRQKYQPKGFEVLLLGKDGLIKTRQSTPVTAEELFRVIDAMPMRAREIKPKEPSS